MSYSITCLCRQLKLNDFLKAQSSEVLSDDGVTKKRSAFSQVIWGAQLEAP